MDRFKFRIYDLEQKHYLRVIQDETTKAEGFAAFYGEYNNICKPMSFFLCHDIDRWVIEQCTGLKDKNGNLIYEGDVVEITIFGSIGPNGGYVDSDEIYKGTVVWDRDCFLVKTDTDTLLFPHSEDCTEIIGNIHEQAEQKDVK